MKYNDVCVRTIVACTTNMCYYVCLVSFWSVIIGHWNGNIMDLLNKMLHYNVQNSRVILSIILIVSQMK